MANNVCVCVVFCFFEKFINDNFDERKQTKICEYRTEAEKFVTCGWMCVCVANRKIF